MFQYLPSDILEIIVKYTPAENIMISAMSKSLRKAVLKAGLPLQILHLFFMNKYGYIYSNSPNKKYIKDGEFIERNFSDELLCYMFEYGELFNYKNISIMDPKYIKLYIKNDKINSQTLLTLMDIYSEENLYSYIDYIVTKKMLKTRYMCYEITPSEPLIGMIIKRLIKKSAVTEQNMNVILGCVINRNHIYESVKVGNYNLAGKLWNEIKDTSGSWELTLRKFIKHDNINALKIFLKIVDKSIIIFTDDLNKNDEIIDSVLHHVYVYDSIRILEYLYTYEVYKTLIQTKNIRYEMIPKISKFLVANSVGIEYDFGKSYLSKLDWIKIYIPNSKAFKCLLTIESFYPNIGLYSISLTQKYNIKKMYQITILTPHPYPFVNKFFKELYMKYFDNEQIS